MLSAAVAGRYAALKRARRTAARLLGTIVKAPEVQFIKMSITRWLWNIF